VVEQIRVLLCNPHLGRVESKNLGV